MSSFNLDQRGMATLYMPTFYTPLGIGFMCCSLFSPLIMIYVPHGSQIQVVFHSLVPFGFQIHIIVHTFILKNSNYMYMCSQNHEYGYKHTTALAWKATDTSYPIMQIRLSITSTSHIIQEPT